MSVCGLFSEILYKLGVAFLIKDEENVTKTGERWGVWKDRESWDDNDVKDEAVWPLILA